MAQKQDRHVNRRNFLLALSRRDQETVDRTSKRVMSRAESDGLIWREQSRIGLTAEGMRRVEKMRPRS